VILGKPSSIPYEMFDLDRTAEEARRAVRLRHIYHSGQQFAWDGRDVLPELIEKHGGIHVSPRVRDALGRVYSVIMWGELAAWKISVQLADDIVPLEPKMAATSQAHDEARHFYVLYDYLRALGVAPSRMTRGSQGLLDHVLYEKNLTHKLLGMQLMVETIALTIFQATREANPEPVLSELLPYYETDEARHVGLGIQHLPDRLRGVGPAGLTRMTVYQLELIYWALASLSDLEKDLETLGISAGRMVLIGTKKQQHAADEMWKILGKTDRPYERMLQRAVHTLIEAWFPAREKRRSVLTRLAAAREVWKAGGYATA
jgi:hypothetical protein